MLIRQDECVMKGLRGIDLLLITVTMNMYENKETHMLLVEVRTFSLHFLNISPARPSGALHGVFSCCLWRGWCVIGRSDGEKSLVIWFT